MKKKYTTILLFSVMICSLILSAGITFAETANDLLKKGEGLFQKGDFRAAVETLRQAITIEPKNKKLWRAYNDAYQADAATRFMATLTGSYNAITYEEFLERKKHNPDIFIIDLRSEKEFNEEHIPGSVSIPLEEMRKKLSMLPELKIHEIVVYCAAGPRSATGQMYVSMLGYTNVKYLRGGMMAYRSAKEKEGK